jgi:hypothetical protein
MSSKQLSRKLIETTVSTKACSIRRGIGQIGWNIHRRNRFRCRPEGCCVGPRCASANADAFQCWMLRGRQRYQLDSDPRASWPSSAESPLRPPANKLPSCRSPCLLFCGLLFFVFFVLSKYTHAFYIYIYPNRDRPRSVLTIKNVRT